MEAEIRKTPRGPERMNEFGNRLAIEVEQQIRAENKIAKTADAQDDYGDTRVHAHGTRTSKYSAIIIEH